MKTLIFNQLFIIDDSSKKARIVSFANGINVVCGNERNEGNWIGKSSLLRSLYHTLGADALYSKTEWEQGTNFLYVLKFTWDDENFVMSRYSGTFKLFKNNRLVFHVTNRNDLSNELNKLFNMQILLQSNPDGKYITATPAVNYLLTFLDQTAIKEFEFKSFDRLGQFKAIYEDVIYSHLGIPLKQINEIIEKINNITELRETEDKNLTILDRLEKEISKNKNSGVIDVEALRVKLQVYEDEYNNILSETQKMKEELYKLYDDKYRLENTIKDLNVAINSTNKNIKIALKKHTCPVCDSTLEDTSSVFFEQSNNAESYKFHLRQIENDLIEIERTLVLKFEKYQSKVDDLKKLELKIFSDEKDIKVQLESIGYRSINEKITKEIGEITNKIKQFDEDIKALKLDLKTLNKVKNEIDGTYIKELTKIVQKYHVPLKMDSITSAASRRKSNSSEGLFVTVAWLNALLNTKYKHNPEATVFPLVFDNPNDADFSDGNERKIFTLIFDHVPTEGQLITSKASFDIKTYPTYSINKIVLDNDKHKLLVPEQYQLALETIKDFF